MGYARKDVELSLIHILIPGDKLFTMPSATSYEFGILMSNVHMAWTRAVCGRLKSCLLYTSSGCDSVIMSRIVCRKLY